MPGDVDKNNASDNGCAKIAAGARMNKHSQESVVLGVLR